MGISLEVFAFVNNNHYRVKCKKEILISDDWLNK
jgi:hypothetical protein